LTRKKALKYIYQWASFNDVVDLIEKTKYVMENGFGGVTIFVTDYDDFDNECQCEAYPLLKTINRVFGLLRDESSAKNCSLFAN
jgi:hypothetical protein